MILYGPLGRLNLFVLWTCFCPRWCVFLWPSLCIAEIGKSAPLGFFCPRLSIHKWTLVTSIIPACSSFSFWGVFCLSDRCSPQHGITRLLHPMPQSPPPQELPREAPSPSTPPCQCCFPAPPGLTEPLPRRPCSNIPSDIS